MMEEIEERVRPMRSYAAWDRIARQAEAEPARLDRMNATWWEDIAEVLLGLNVRPRDAETVQRWLREEVHRFLIWELGTSYSRYLVEDACEASPRLIWMLPPSICPPPVRSHRRIAAILLSAKLRQLVLDLKRLARERHP